MKMKVSVVLAVLAVFACSDATGDVASTGFLSGTVTDAGGAAVPDARVVVASGDGSIVPQHDSGVLTGGDGGYRIELLSVNFTQRKTTGQVTVTPPEGSPLAERVVAGVVLETGPGSPETIVDVILDEP